MWGIGMAIEEKMRREATELVGNNLEAELAPMSFSHKDGREVICEAPIVFIPVLWEKVKGLLDQNTNENRG